VYVREGQRVRAGEVLARFEASEQASAQKSAEADRISARGELATATWTHEQNQELFKAGAIPERDLKASEQAVNSARARLAAAESRLKSSSVVVGDTRVVAPLSGIVEKRLVENGEHVARGATMFTVVRNDALELAASVPAKRASGVTTGQLVYFNADGREFTGKVARVSPTIDPATRAITVYVQVPNTSGALKGGTFASGRVVGRSATNVIAVPSAALRQGRDGLPYVYLINGKSLEQRKVTLGIVDEVSGTAEVKEGLKDGDRIVVGNVGTLGAGMNVQVVGEREQKPGG
jgi:RND family efflux transporter MFP subunit